MTPYNNLMANALTLEQHIEATPEIRSGKPRFAGTRLTVADVAVMHLRLGYSLAEIAGDYNVSLAAIHAAMSYYYDHQDKIEADMAESKQFAADLAKSTPSLLQEKLKNGRA